MPSVQSCELPADTLLRRSLREGAYADCYVTELPRPVSHADYVEAFYTTALFKLERWMLGLFCARPSTDVQARQLADGSRDSFAAWSVDARSPDQLLLADFSGRTRSWLMTVTIECGGKPGTRLYFGSSVVPALNKRSGRTEFGFMFRSLLGFHELYSRALLSAASAWLVR